MSPELIRAAKKRLREKRANVEFYVKDAQALNYPDDYFDGAIFSFNGIAFIPRTSNKLHLLENVYRMLKPGSYFFFTAHNSWAVNTFLLGNILRKTKIFLTKLFCVDIREQEYGEKYNDTPGDEVPYIDIKSRKKWKEIVKKSGFEIAYFNSKYGIKEDRNFSVVKDYFGSGNYLFFVLQKPVETYDSSGRQVM